MTTTVDKSSDLRKKYGHSKAPIKATKVFRRVLPHFQARNIDGVAWVLIDEEAGTRVSVNTYNGAAGKNFRANVLPLPTDQKELAALTKGYEEVEVGVCPIAATE